MICTVCQVLPENLPGFTVYHVTQDYLIFINTNMSEAEQELFYKGEEEKIEKGFYVSEIVRSTSNNTVQTV